MKSNENQEFYPCKVKKIEIEVKDPILYKNISNDDESIIILFIYCQVSSL